MRLVAPLEHRPHSGDAGGAQELLELSEMVVLTRRDGGDHDGALAGPATLALAILARRAASVISGSAFAQLPEMVAP
jgi:hypothetical protein